MNQPENKPKQEPGDSPAVKVILGWQAWIMLIFLFGILRGAIETSARYNSQQITQLQNEVRSLQSEVSQLQLKIDQLLENPD